MNCYMDLVAKGLEGDVALLHVHGIVGEVHVAADVEVHPLAVAHHAVLVHLDRLGGVVKFGLPETIHNAVFHFFKSSKPDRHHFVDENVRPPEPLVVLGNLHEVVGGVLRAREARERGWIGGESGSLLLQRQFAVVPVSPGGEESSNFGLKIFHWLPQADLEGDHHLGVVHLDNVHVDS